MKIIVKLIVIIFVITVGLILFILENKIAGWRAFIVSSGSMEPNIKTGSLLITNYLKPNNLVKGDIITFIPPIKQREFVTHRISEISQKESVVIIKTKGDNNKTLDPWILAGGGVVGKVFLTIPSLGYLFSFAQTKIGILLLVLLPAMYIIVGEIYNIIYTLRHPARPAKLEERSGERSERSHANTSTIILLFLCIIFFFTPHPTQALLSDTSSLTGNTIIIACGNNNNSQGDSHPNNGNHFAYGHYKCHDL